MTINYKAPLRDMEFVYYELFDGEALTKLPGYEEAEPETVKAILQEAAKMADKDTWAYNFWMQTASKITKKLERMRRPL